jgi:hypothetical protein
VEKMQWEDVAEMTTAKQMLILHHGSKPSYIVSYDTINMEPP